MTIIDLVSLIMIFSGVMILYYQANYWQNKHDIDTDFLNRQLKYWQNSYEALKKKQQPRLKNGRYARKVK